MSKPSSTSPPQTTVMTPNDSPSLDSSPFLTLKLPQPLPKDPICQRNLLARFVLFTVNPPHQSNSETSLEGLRSANLDGGRTDISFILVFMRDWSQPQCSAKKEIIQLIFTLAVILAVAVMVVLNGQNIGIHLGVLICSSSFPQEEEHHNSIQMTYPNYWQNEL